MFNEKKSVVGGSGAADEKKQSECAPGLTGNLPPLQLLHSSGNPSSTSAAAHFLSALPGASVCSRRSPGSAAARDEDEEEDDSSESSSGSSSVSDEDEWGTVRQGIDFKLGSSSSDEVSGDVHLESSLFIPEPVFQLTSLTEKPIMPCHSVEELPLGTKVWVVDEEDVEMLLLNNWDSAYQNVCNGKRAGTVSRHSGAMTMVMFQDNEAGLTYVLAIPRKCLSLKQIEAYDSAPRPNHHAMASCYGNLGPRAVRVTSSANSGATCHPTASACGGGSGSGDTCEERVSCVSAWHCNSRAEFYETLTTITPEAFEKHPELREANEHIMKTDYVEAVSAVDKFLRSDARPYSPYHMDALLLRSRALVFLGRFEEAYADAEECISLEPRWIRGFVSSARALSGLGDFEAARDRLARALALAPNSSDVRRVNDLNNFMCRLQHHITAHYLVKISLDGMYRRRLIPLAPIAAPGRVVCSEDTPIAAMHSISSSSPPGRCCVCYRDGAEDLGAISDRAAVSSSTSASPIESTSEHWSIDLPLSNVFCSRACQRRSTLFLGLETKYREAIDHVRELLIAKAARTVNPLPMESMNVTLRVFFIVKSTHLRLVRKRREWIQDRALAARASDTTLQDTISSRCSPFGITDLPVELALRHLGIYPLISHRASVRVCEEIVLIYNLLTERFTDEEKTVYTPELFLGLFHYTYAYVTRVELPLATPAPSMESSTNPTPTGPSAPCAGLPLPPRPTVVYFLPSFVTSIARISKFSCVVADGLASTTAGAPKPSRVLGGTCTAGCKDALELRLPHGFGEDDEEGGIPEKVGAGVRPPCAEKRAVPHVPRLFHANCTIRLSADAQQHVNSSSHYAHFLRNPGDEQVPRQMQLASAFHLIGGSVTVDVSRKMRGPLLELVSLEPIKSTDPLYWEIFF